MPGKRILWLASWYPSRIDPFNGDFIQRHARAASLLHDIHVIHIIKDGSLPIGKSEQHVLIKEDVKEIIIYYNPGNSKLRNAFMWYRLMRTAIKENFQQYKIAHAVHVHIPWKMGLIGRWASKKYKIPLIVSEHWGIYNDIVSDHFNNQSAFVRNEILNTIKKSHRLHSVSRFLGEKIKSLTRVDYLLIPNVVDTKLFFHQPGTGSKPFTFIHVSNLVPLKNVEGIISAAAILKKNNPSLEFMLKIIGGRSPTLEELAIKKGLENIVIFQGIIPYQKVAEEMQHAQALILFSEMENAPCVISEAHCCGIPVIATNVGGIPEMVNDKNGELIDSGNENALASKMKDILFNYDRVNQIEIATNAYNLYSYEVVSNQFDKLYENL